MPIWYQNRDNFVFYWSDAYVTFPQGSPASCSASYAVPPLRMVWNLRADLFLLEYSSKMFHTPPSDGSSKILKSDVSRPLCSSPSRPSPGQLKGRWRQPQLWCFALSFTHLQAMLLSLGWIYNTHKLFSISPFSLIPPYSSKIML